ncbi:MAG: hypothetical protein LBG93_02190 [Treponema sp.]|nr:hypothetical protein [Treponema sp.]
MKYFPPFRFLPLLLLLTHFFCGISFLAALNGSEEDTIFEEPAFVSDRIYITGISITGLMRTRLSAAERALRRFIGMEVNSLNPDDVAAAIESTIILRPLSVEIQGQVLAVEVYERWSIFPIPIITGDAGGIGGGASFFDANAFGLIDQMYVTAIFNAEGWTVTAGYFFSRRAAHLPSIANAASFSMRERHDRDQNNYILRRFNVNAVSFHSTINFPLIANSDLLYFSALFSFNDRRSNNLAYILPEEPSSLYMFGAGGELSLHKNTWDGYFISQRALSVRYVIYTNFSNNFFETVQIRAAWEQPIIPGFRANLRMGLFFAPQAPVLFESLPVAAQIVILPKNFSAQNYASVSASLEKSLFRFRLGTLSVSLGYQLAHSRGTALPDFSFDHGYMGMLSFYITRLRAPVLSMGVSHNVRSDFLQTFISFAISY